MALPPFMQLIVWLLLGCIGIYCVDRWIPGPTVLKALIYIVICVVLVYKFLQFFHMAS